MLEREQTQTKLIAEAAADTVPPMPKKQPVEHSEVAEGDWGGGAALNQNAFEVEPIGADLRYNAQAE